MFDDWKKKFKGFLPEKASRSKREEKEAEEEKRQKSEKDPIQPGKTLDGKFVRRFVDANGVAVEEYDFSQPGDSKAKWRPNTQAVAKRGEVNGQGLARRGDNQLAKKNAHIVEVDLTGRQKEYSEKESNLIKDRKQEQLAGKEQKLLSEGIQKETRRVVIADITPIVDRYAKTLAVRKLNENIEKSSRFSLKRALYRLAEAGYTDEKSGKYFLEARQEILKNRNLLSTIETKLMRKSEGKALAADADDIHNEILDEVIKAFQESKDLLDKNTRTQEVKAEHVDLGAAQNARIDTVAADIVVDFALGNITDQKTFDARVEQRVVPLLAGAGAKQGEGRMYANSLFEMARGYKHQIEEKLNVVGKEFGPDQKEYAERFIRGTLHLDIMLGEKGADLYQTKPENVMRGYEKFVDHVQNGTILGWGARKMFGDEKGGKIGRVIGRVLSNPIAYAVAGNVIGRGAAKAVGMGAGTAAGVSLSIFTGLAFMPATLAILGTGVAAGWYLGARAAREKRRDIGRREQEAVLGLRDKENMEVWQAEKLIAEIQTLQGKADLLAEEEKKYIGQIQARLDLQSKHGIDLIGVSKETGEKYGTKFVEEQKLRKALKDFCDAKIMEYGQTPKEQLVAYRRYQGEAERFLVGEIDKVNKDKAEQIRKYRNKVAVIGGVAAMGAAVLGPLASKGAKAGFNYLFHTHFDVNNVTYLEEAWHLAKAKLGYGHSEALYSGALLDGSLTAIQAKINLPPGFGALDQGLDSHGNHLIAILDAHGQVIPGGEHIPINAGGNIADPHALDALRHGGWDIHETAGVAGAMGTGTNYSESALRAMGFDKHIRADWHHIHDALKEISKHIFNGKELQAYKHVVGGGDEQWDVQKMLGNLTDNAEKAHLLGDKFGIDTTGHIDTQLQALKDQMVGWYASGDKAEVAKHLVMRVIASEHDNKVTGLTKVFNFDSDGHLNLPHEYANAAYKEIALVDDHGFSHVVATEHLAGHEMLSTGPSGAPGVLDFRSPMPHVVDGPWTLAGYKRETDKDVEKQKRKEEEKRKKAEAKKLAKETEAKQKAEAERAGAEAEKAKKAQEEVIAKLDKKSLDEKAFNEVAEKYSVDKETLAKNTLEAKGIDYQANEAAVINAAKEHGTKQPTKLELYLLMLAMFQAGIDLGKKSGKVVSIESAKQTEAENIELDDDYDEAEELKKAGAKIVGKEKPAPKGKKKVINIDKNKKSQTGKRKTKPKPAEAGKKGNGEKETPSKQEQIRKHEGMVRGFEAKFPQIQLEFGLGLRDFSKFNEPAQKKFFAKLEKVFRSLGNRLNKFNKDRPLKLNISDIDDKSFTQGTGKVNKISYLADEAAIFRFLKGQIDKNPSARERVASLKKKIISRRAA